MQYRSRTCPGGICKKYKKVPPRLVVGLPGATDFNQSVAIDLHYIDKKLWHVHIIDEFSCYSNPPIIKKLFTKLGLHTWKSYKNI